MPYFTLCFFILFIVLFFGIYPRQSQKRSQKLLDYFNGQFRYPLGDLIIPYQKHEFFISRISRGGGLNNNPGGSYPLLWTYVEQTPKILIGHEQSGNFAIGKFLILPKFQKKIIQSSLTLLLATDNSDIFSKNLNLSGTAILFENEFQHLTLSSEIHIINFLPQKKYLFKYTGASEEIYQQPELLKFYLDKILFILAQLNIKISSTSNLS